MGEEQEERDKGMKYWMIEGFFYRGGLLGIREEEEDWERNRTGMIVGRRRRMGIEDWKKRAEDWRGKESII